MSRSGFSRLQSAVLKRQKPFELERLLLVYNRTKPF